MHVSLDDAQWSLTVTLLMSCVASPIMGRLSDGPHRRAVALDRTSDQCSSEASSRDSRRLARRCWSSAVRCRGSAMGLAPVRVMAAAQGRPVASAIAERVIAILSVTASCRCRGCGLSDQRPDRQGVRPARRVLLRSAVERRRAARRRDGDPEQPRDPPASSRLRRRRRDDDRAGRAGAGNQRGARRGDGARRGPSDCSPWRSWRSRSWVPQQLHHRWPLANLRLLRHRSVLSANLAGIILGVALYMYLSLVTELVQEPKSLGYGLDRALVAGWPDARCCRSRSSASRSAEPSAPRSGGCCRRR